MSPLIRIPGPFSSACSRRRASEVLYSAGRTYARTPFCANGLLLYSYQNILTNERSHFISKASIKWEARLSVGKSTPYICGFRQGGGS